MKQPTPGRRYRAAIAHLDTETGALSIASIAGERLVIELGPGQIISIKRGCDIYVAAYEAVEVKSA